MPQQPTIHQRYEEMLRRKALSRGSNSRSLPATLQEAMQRAQEAVLPRLHHARSLDGYQKTANPMHRGSAQLQPPALQHTSLPEASRIPEQPGIHQRYEQMLREHALSRSSDSRSLPADMVVAHQPGQQASASLQNHARTRAGRARYQQAAETMRRETVQHPQAALHASASARFAASQQLSGPALQGRESYSSHQAMRGRDCFHAAGKTSVPSPVAAIDAPDLYTQLCMEESASLYHRQAFAASLSNIFQHETRSSWGLGAQATTPVGQQGSRAVRQQDFAGSIHGAHHSHRSRLAHPQAAEQGAPLHHSKHSGGQAGTTPAGAGTAREHNIPGELAISDEDSTSCSQPAHSL